MYRCDRKIVLIKKVFCRAYLFYTFCWKKIAGRGLNLPPPLIGDTPSLTLLIFNNFFFSYSSLFLPFPYSSPSSIFIPVTERLTNNLLTFFRELGKNSEKTTERRSSLLNTSEKNTSLPNENERKNSFNYDSIRNSSATKETERRSSLLNDNFERRGSLLNENERKGSPLNENERKNSYLRNNERKGSLLRENNRKNSLLSSNENERSGLLNESKKEKRK